MLRRRRSKCSRKQKGNKTDGEERRVQKAESGCLRNLRKEQTEGKSDAADDLKQCIAAGAKDFNRLPKGRIR